MMDIQLKISSITDNRDGTQAVKMIITADGESHRWIANTPVLEGEPLTSYLEVNKDQYAHDMLYEVYGGVVPPTREGETQIEAWERFIKDGKYSYTVTVNAVVKKEIPAEWEAPVEEVKVEG
jgi:hypothetical protein